MAYKNQSILHDIAHNHPVWVLIAFWLFMIFGSTVGDILRWFRS